MITKRLLIKLLPGLFFFLPFSAQSQNFSIVVLPDSQFYSENFPEVIEAQIDWIVANEVAENIIYVAQLGDLKDDATCDDRTVSAGTGGGRTEWQIVSDAYADLDTAGIPYSVVPGNHDFDQFAGGCPNWTNQRPLVAYNANFGPLRFSGAPWYGDPGVPTPGNRVVDDPGTVGIDESSNEDNFTLFGFGGVNFIAINLAYKQGANPVGMDPEVTWANNLLSTYSDRLGIITSHYLVEENPGNAFGPYGQEIYDALSGNPNLFMMLSAHERGEAWRVDATGRDPMQPVQAILADYQDYLYPSAPINYATLPQGPRSSGGNSGFMRIMRFDTTTGMVNVETFAPPVPELSRATTIVSDYFPADGTGMDSNSASNFSFSYLGYVTLGATPVELVSCGVDTTGGDLLDRGFYHPSYPGSSLESVELFISSRDAGSHTVRLDARLNAYDGALIASDSQTRTLSGIDTDNVSFLFDMGGAAVAPGSVVTFQLTLESGPGTQQVFYAVDTNLHLPGGPGLNCDMIETNGTTPPLDTTRRDGLWIRINGLP